MSESEGANLASLCTAWEAAKSLEIEFSTERRRLEDLIAVEVQLPMSGSTELSAGLVVRTSIKHTVDPARIYELSAEHGLENILPLVCRWKPELVLSEWGRLPADVRDKLAPAITQKPARPGFSKKKQRKGDSK